MRKFVLSPLTLLLLGLHVAAQAGSNNSARTVPPHSIETCTRTFRINETVIVVVSGDGSADLNVSIGIFDQTGYLISANDDFTNDCTVGFVPPWTGPFTIRVVNHEPRPIDYVIVVH